MLPRTWPYRRCADMYSVVPPSRDVASSIVLHRGSGAITPACLLPDEAAALACVDTTAGVSVFDSCALAFVEPTQHTMAYSLPAYCLSKVPKEVLHCAVQVAWPLRCVGFVGCLGIRAIGTLQPSEGCTRRCTGEQCMVCICGHYMYERCLGGSMAGFGCRCRRCRS